MSPPRTTYKVMGYPIIIILTMAAFLGCSENTSIQPKTGVLWCPKCSHQEILLFDNPKPITDGKVLKAPHGTPVNILETHYQSTVDKKFYKVETISDKPMTGWVSEDMIKLDWI